MSHLDNVADNEIGRNRNIHNTYILQIWDKTTTGRLVLSHIKAIEAVPYRSRSLGRYQCEMINQILGVEAFELNYWLRFSVKTNIYHLKHKSPFLAFRRTLPHRSWYFPIPRQRGFEHQICSFSRDVVASSENHLVVFFNSLGP